MSGPETQTAFIIDSLKKKLQEAKAEAERARREANEIRHQLEEVIRERDNGFDVRMPPNKPIVKYNLRKRPAATSALSVSFNDDVSSEDEVSPVAAKKIPKRRIRTPSTTSASVNESSSSDSSSSSDESDDDNEDFAEYINYEQMESSSASSKQQHVCSSFFRLLKHNHLGNVIVKLFIFTPGRKPLCNNFTWLKTEKRFQCIDCSIKADLHKNERGKIYVTLSAPSHKCLPRVYNPEKFQHQVIKRPNFEIVEFQCEGVTKKKLLVFDENNTEMGYDYIWSKANNEFRCGPCSSRRCVRAKVFKDKDGEECIQLGKAQHVCTLRSINVENLAREKRILTDSDFTIITNGQKRNLFVFDSEDRTKCYKYYWAPSANVFICNGCRCRDYYVYAKFKPGNDEKTIILGDTNHVCPLLNFEPPTEVPDVEEINSGFEYLTFGKEPPKVIIFLDDAKKKCYEFAAIRHRNQYSDKFLCIGCNGSPVRPRIIAKLILCENDDGQKYLKMLQPQHTCTPRKYEPTKFKKTIIKPPNFLFCEYKDEISTKLILFHPAGQRKYCYMYGLNRDFQCVQCRKMKKLLTAKVLQDEAGDENIMVKFFDHICKPLKWREISRDCQILRDSGLFKRKKIIKNGEYEFRKNNSRSENGYLLIFDQKNKKLCYGFRRDPRTRLYYCIKCKEMNHQINGKLCENGNIEIEGDDHLCDPQPYEPAKNIVEASNYEIFKSKNDNDQLAIFTSANKKIGYKYGYVKDKKIFVCYACREQRPFVFARICQRVNGEEYVQLSETKHICKPKKLNFD